MNDLKFSDAPVMFEDKLSEAETNIASLLMSNNDITRLLKYDSPNALDESNPVTSAIKKEIYVQSSPTKRFFLMGFDTEAVKEVRSEIHISFGNVTPVQFSTIKIPYLYANIIVAVDINPLSNGFSMRHNVLFQKFNDTIEGKNVGTYGKIILSRPANEIILRDNTHVGWSAVYQIGEIKR